MKLWAGPDLEMIHWIIFNVCKYNILLSQHTDGMFSLSPEWGDKERESEGGNEGWGGGRKGEWHNRCIDYC